MKTLSFTTLIFILLGFWSCNKDKTESPIGFACEEFPDLNVSFFSSERYQYMTPCFNPNNSNEFVYSFEDKGLSINRLMSYNMLTHVKTVLANDVKIISQPKWSAQGWIAFDNVFNGDYQIWKVKSNGDSLEQMSSNIFNLFPSWDANGDFVYYQHTSTLGNPYYTLKQGLYSSTIDTVYHNFASYIDISANDKMFAKYYDGSVTQFGTSYIGASLNFLSLINADANNLFGLSGTCWSGSGNEIYFSCVNGFDSNGLYRMNASNGSNEHLIEYCDNRHYTVISCSSDDHSLIVEKVLSTLILDVNNEPTGEIRRQSKIYLIDLETLKEKEVNLD